jgi:hypothetical protein
MALKRPRSNSVVTAKRRRVLVEEMIRTKGWTEPLVADLARKTGASRRTLYRDREAILKELAAEEKAGLEERRALLLGDARRMREKAVKDGDYSPAARLLGMEAQLLGLDRVPLPEVDAEEGPVDTSLEAILKETRRMRRQAQAGHSYVAADRLLQREHELVESIRQRDEAVRAQNLSHMGEDEKVALVTELLTSLPDLLRRKVLAGLPA